MKTIRLDKLISDATGMGRAAARRTVRRGRARVNGLQARDPGLHVSPDDAVVLNGDRLGCRRYVYLMLNKPPGYVCSTDDPDHLTVLQLIPHELRVRKPHAAGRLDIDATGLVLLTDDGEWSHRLTAPRHKAEKVYEVETAVAITPDAVAELESGVHLRGDIRPTRPARLVLRAPTHAELTVTEGRFHQVKRMFAAVDNRVVRIHRVRIGGISLDSELEPGQCRELTEDEMKSALPVPAAALSAAHDQRPPPEAPVP